MANFDDILDDFDFIDDWEERYKYLIDMGKDLSPLTATEMNDANKVRGCTSQVWIVFDQLTKDVIIFRGASDAHIVSGLIGLLRAIYNGKSAKEILAIDPYDLFTKIDLKDHLSTQRSNGLKSMIDRLHLAAKNTL